MIVLKNDPLPLLRFTVDGVVADVRKSHPLDVAKWVALNEGEITDRLMNRRSEPYPPELPLPELLHVDADALEMVMRFSALYRGRLTDAQATLRKRMLADATGSDSYIATGKTRNGRISQPARELTGERLKDARWLVRDWPSWARQNVSDIVARNGGQTPDPSALAVELAQRSNLNVGILCRFHRNSELFRAAVKEAGARWPDRLQKRALLSEYGPHIPGTKALPANVRLRSPEWFTFEQRPIR